MYHFSEGNFEDLKNIRPLIQALRNKKKCRKRDGAEVVLGVCFFIAITEHSKLGNL